MDCLKLNSLVKDEVIDEREAQMEYFDKYEEEMERWALENRTRANRILDKLVVCAIVGMWACAFWLVIAAVK